jgi:predicted permease
MNVLLTDPRKPYWIKVTTDWPVLVAVAALTVAVGLVAGLVPALRTSRLRPSAVLRDGGGAGQLALGRVGRGLSLVQIALAATVLTVGAVLWRGVLQLARENYPPDAAHVLAASRLSAPPARTEASAAAASRRLLPDLLERAARLPGVERTAATGRGGLTPLVVEGFDRSESAKADQFPSLTVSADYFAVFGTGALRGRVFGAGDFAPGAARVVLVNESAARRYWPGADPLGRRVRYEDADGLGDWSTVVGIVPDLPLSRRSWELHTPGIYAPLDPTAATDATLLVRTAGDPATLVGPVRRVLQELAPDAVFYLGVQPLRSAIDAQLQILRLLSGLAAVFGGCGVLLAALGIFGVQAFFVESRRREFGVRLALGARPAQLVRDVLRRGAAQLALGAPLGLVGGWALVRVLRGTTLLSPVAKIDAGACAMVAGVLGLAVLFACWLPARRAAKVDPMVALRCD